MAQLEMDMMSFFNISRAIINAQEYLKIPDEYRLQIKQQKLESSKRRIFLHIPFHPHNPPSHELQQLWRDAVFEPKGEQSLNKIKLHGDVNVPIDKMAIAYTAEPQTLSICLAIARFAKDWGRKCHHSSEWLDIISKS